MRLKLIILSALALTGCDTLTEYAQKFQSLSCTEKAAIASETLGTATDTAVSALQSKTLKQSKYDDAIAIIDSTHTVVESAGSLCGTDKTEAERILLNTQSTIQQVLKIINEGDQE